MSVIVTMEVGPVDNAKFQSAVDWMNGQTQAGHISTQVLRQESDPKTLLIIQEWDSHDSFHKASDKVGDEFNRRAGTEGLDWRTGVWTK